MKRWLKPIQVSLNPQGDPRTLTYKNRSRRVEQVLDAWRYGGRWWRGEGPRDYYLLELEGRLVAEVYQEGGGWVLSRTDD